MGLEQGFESAMVDIYRQAKRQCNYNATRFLQVIDHLGGFKQPNNC